MLERACAQAAAWPADGASLAGTSTCPAASSPTRDCPSAYARRSREPASSPRLCLAVSECTVNADPDARFAALRETGVALALDDLGPDMPRLAALTELRV